MKKKDDASPNIEQFYQRIQRMGLRSTLPRRVILETLLNTSEYMSAEDVFNHIHKEYPGIGLATVYRTLILMEQLNIVHKFEFGEGKARYEISKDDEDPHFHFLLCDHCHKVIPFADFSDKEKKFYKNIEKQLEKEHHFSINRHVVQFWGICGDCKSQENN